VALTPTDVHNKEFHRKMRGYAEDEVDEFLDEIVREFEALLRDRDQTRLQLEEAERNLTRFHELEEHLQRALVVAQQTADDLRQNAQKEAELLLREAQQRAEQVIEQARTQVREVERDFAERRRELEVWKAKVRSLLESELTLLANEPITPQAQRAEA
jgi:cell division initiation protein